MTQADAETIPGGATAKLDFAAIFRVAPRPLLIMAADPPRFTIVAVNDAHAQAFGVTPEALVGRGVLEVFPENPSPVISGFMTAIRESLAFVMTQGAPHRVAERAHESVGSDGQRIERYWSAINAPLRSADGTITHIMSAVLDVTADVLEQRREAARELVAREVDHRARNTLNIVRSFVRLTGGDDLPAYRAALEGRIDNLARIHSSLASHHWAGGELREVLDCELAALAPAGRYTLAGPRIPLSAQSVQAVSMVLHELATNASKYGALSSANGTLEIRWRRRGDDRLEVVWRERGGPPVRAPTTTGFGSRLIDQLVRQMRGEVCFQWRATGLVATFDLPLAGVARKS